VYLDADPLTGRDLPGYGGGVKAANPSYVRTPRLTRLEYEALVERGVLDEDDRIELLDGRLVFREPQGSRHAAACLRIRIALDRAFGRGYHVRSQFPIALDDVSEPEPDIAVVRGRIEDYLDAHPTAPVLVVEVADSSLARDRDRKGSLYARAGVADYWIVNLLGGVLEVYRDPERPAAGRWRYATVRVLKPRDGVSPLAAPRARLRVARLLA
jgi:Uma2 family endonuclease